MTAILLTTLVAAVAALVAIRVTRNRAKAKAIVEAARARAEERNQNRAYMDTEPAEDPYDRVYSLGDAMLTVEVDESANGYGMLSDEQKEIITAIFDSGPTKVSRIDRTIVGNKWPGSVFSDLNQVEQIPERDIWSNSRN